MCFLILVVIVLVAIVLALVLVVPQLVYIFQMVFHYTIIFSQYNYDSGGHIFDATPSVRLG